FFDQRPAILPNLGPDTNHNGTLGTDLNGNGAMDAWERDPGEDYDGDGKFDVFEDKNFNGRLDPGEDKDGDGRLTPYVRKIFYSYYNGTNWVLVYRYSGACEGAKREDQNCNGQVDPAEDVNQNGILDPAEDINGDGVLSPAEVRAAGRCGDRSPPPDDQLPPAGREHGLGGGDRRHRRAVRPGHVPADPEPEPRPGSEVRARNGQHDRLFLLRAGDRGGRVR